MPKLTSIAAAQLDRHVNQPFRRKVDFDPAPTAGHRGRRFQCNFNGGVRMVHSNWQDRTVKVLLRRNHMKPGRGGKFDTCSCISYGGDEAQTLAGGSVMLSVRWRQAA